MTYYTNSVTVSLFCDLGILGVVLARNLILNAPATAPFI